jgi:hypothetical protein
MVLFISGHCACTNVISATRLSPLISNTAGCITVDPPEFYDAQSVSENWHLMRKNPVFKSEILKALKPIRDWIGSMVNWACQDELNSLFKRVALYVSPPYADDRFPSVT